MHLELRSTVAVACILLANPAAALPVRLQVQRLAPAGVAVGGAGPEGVVSIGVPLDPTHGIESAAELGVAGANAAQFRILQRDRDSGRPTWVLATFPAQPGGEYSLTRGQGDFGGAALARLEADRIVVATGAATFEIKRQGFNGLDHVVRNRRDAVPTHSGGGLVLLAGGVRYESGRDAASEVVVEDNGPVAAVIRARGTLRSAIGERGLDYTVRLRFARGSAACRADVSLHNATLASPASRRFDAAWFEIPLAAAPAGRDLLFGFAGEGFGGRVPAGRAAHLLQGDNPYQRSPRTTTILPELTDAVGLEVVIDGVLHNRLGTVTDVARGWMRLQAGSDAILAGMRDFATLFPSGFDLRGDTLAAEIFSRHNPHGELTFSWGAHETREIGFEFADAGADPEAFRQRLQYPLGGRAAFESLRDSGALWGERRLVTAEEERRYFAELGHDWSVRVLGEGDLRLERQYSFGTTGGSNQFDQDECRLLDYLRGGDAGTFLQARLGVLWKADQAVLHSDDFDYGARQNGVSDVRFDAPASFHGKGAGSLFDDEHPHWTCLPLYYWMTGDERVREAAVEYGEWRRYRAGNPTYGAINGGATSHFRTWSRAYRDVALLSLFTAEPRYLEDLRRMTDVLTGTIERGTSRGRNLERGYWYFGEETDAQRRIHLFFLIEMNAIGVHAALAALPDSDPRREDLRDYFTGLAYFSLESQISPQAAGYPYGYFAAAPNPEWGVRGDQTGFVLAHGYETTGDEAFLHRSRALAWRVLEYQHWLRGSELSTHARIYRWMYRNDGGVVRLRPVAERSADGRWTLRWTAPTGARSYIVHYGPRPIVEALGFDAEQRVFHIDPASAMNVWAAANLPGEPTPGPAGASESFSTPPLPAGVAHFSVHALTERPTRLETGALRATSRPRSATIALPRPGGARSNPAGLVRLARPGREPLRAEIGSAGVHFAPLTPPCVVRVYSAAGRLLREQEITVARDWTWDFRDAGGTSVAAGIYLYRVESGNAAPQRGRVVLVH